MRPSRPTDLAARFEHQREAFARDQRDGVYPRPSRRLRRPGGAFCLGGPHTHRGVTTRLAVEGGLPVWVPDYRLAPEHPSPAALDAALAAYDALRAQDQEVRLSDAQRLEVHAAHWHVFHQQAFYLRSTRDALRTLAGFAPERVAAMAAA